MSLYHVIDATTQTLHSSHDTSRQAWDALADRQQPGGYEPLLVVRGTEERIIALLEARAVDELCDLAETESENAC